ncbi:MAG: sigma-70 family RNA polymerase sigma factor [Ktedonobacteraceae bacterium]
MSKKRNQEDQDVSLLAFDQYMRWVRHLQRVSSEDQVQLLQRVACGKAEGSKPCPDQCVLAEATAARERLVEEYQSLVIGIAKRLARHFRCMQLEDVIQEGNVGLLEALECHDGSQHQNFPGLVALCVRRAILNALYYRERLVRHSQHLHRVLAQVQEVEHRLRNTCGAEPTVAALAQEMGVSEERVRQVLAWREQEQVLSLQALVPDGDAENEVSFVSLYAAQVVGDELRREQRTQAVKQAIEQVLRGHEQEVLVLRYGLEAEPHSQSEVARALGLQTRSIERIEARAKGRLHQALAPLCLLADEEGVLS